MTDAETSGGRIIELSGGGAAAGAGSATLQVIRAVHDVVSVADSFTVTEATDVRALAQRVEMLTQQVNALLTVRAADAPAAVAGPVGRYVREHLLELLTLLVTLAAFRQDRAEYTRPDPVPTPPPVVVVEQPAQPVIVVVPSPAADEPRQVPHRAHHHGDGHHHRPTRHTG